MDHLLKHHPDDYRQLVADQARAEARELARMRAQADADRVAEEARLRALAEAAAREEAAKVIAAQESARLAAEALRRAPACKAQEHQQLEASYHAAGLGFGEAEKRVDDPNINPKQQGYARKALGPAVKKHLAAQAAFDGHLKAHHALEWKRIVAARAAAAKKAALLKK